MTLHFNLNSPFGLYTEGQVKRGLEDTLHGICPALLSSLWGVWSKLAFLPIIVMSVYKGTFVLIDYILQVLILILIYIKSSIKIFFYYFYSSPFVCRKVVSFRKVNSGENEFLESEFRESIFRCLAVLWKMNWKTLFSVCLCYEKWTGK